MTAATGRPGVPAVDGRPGAPAVDGPVPGAPASWPDADTTVVVLCGGRGTRAWPGTAEVPKPLLPVAGRPVLGHVLEVFAVQGVTRFVLSAGYLADRIAAFARTLPPAWDVEVVDTGVEAGTGQRITRVADRLGDRLGPRFLATYGDGLADVSLAALGATHLGHGGAATVTTVPLPSPYGTITADRDGRVTAFAEKPTLPDHRINGGFLAFEARALAHLEAGPDLERDGLPALVAAGELFTHDHPGFWGSLDTLKDARTLTELAEAEEGPPWRPT